MSRILRRFAQRSHAPRCCNAQPMDWDVFLGQYVCWACGKKR
ncbi:hypothetical protein [Nocardiopsis sp. NPDC055824]